MDPQPRPLARRRSCRVRILEFHAHTSLRPLRPDAPSASPFARQNSVPLLWLFQLESFHSSKRPAVRNGQLELLRDDTNLLTQSSRHVPVRIMPQFSRSLLRADPAPASAAGTYRSVPAVVCAARPSIGSSQPRQAAATPPGSD